MYVVRSAWLFVGDLGSVAGSNTWMYAQNSVVFCDGALRVISDCRFRKKATEYVREPGIKWFSCTAKG
jgi:hypothetical protein